MHATAAMQGVYSRENTSRDAAESGVSTASRSAVLPKREDEGGKTTLSLAMKPVSSAVQMPIAEAQRLKERGEPAAVSASRLSLESRDDVEAQIERLQEQMTIVAAKMTVKARWRKSLDFSHRSWQTSSRPACGNSAAP